MFGFLEEIGEKTGLPFDILSNGFRIINFSNKSVFIEGYKNIISFQDDEISIKLKKGLVIIQGKNLKIKDMNAESLIVNGEILNITIS